MLFVSAPAGHDMRASTNPTTFPRPDPYCGLMMLPANQILADGTRSFQVLETGLKFKSWPLDMVVEYPILTLYRRKTGARVIKFSMEQIKRCVYSV